MKESIKKIVLRELSWGAKPHLHWITKQGNLIIRKQELQHMVCEAQKEHYFHKLGREKTSPSIIEYRDRNGDICFHHSTGFYNDAFGQWVNEGLITRSRKEGYQITDYGKLYTATDTRAYEIEFWKRKFKKEQAKAQRFKEYWKGKYEEMKEQKNVDKELYANFGSDFMNSDNKGSLQEVAEDVADICRITEPINISDMLLDYDDTRDVAIRCVDKLVDSKILSDTHQFEVQDTIHDEINEALKITDFDTPIKSSPSNSIINDCLSNIQNEIESIKNTFKE